MHQEFIRRFAIGLLVLGAGLWGWEARAIAAEEVVLTYRILEARIAVDDLTTFAETGEASRPLSRLLRRANQNPDRLRNLLTREVEVDPIFLDRALNNVAGELVLDQIGEVIHTRSRTADRQALRSALVLSATDDNHITVLEVLQNYPTDEVYVDGDRLAEVYHQIRGLQENLGHILGDLDWF